MRRICSLHILVWIYNRNMKRLLYITAVLLLSVACSTTKNLPEGEVLYTGQKPMVVHNRATTRLGNTAMEEVEAALAKAPNNALLGSSERRIPFPLGLWIYNAFVNKEKGIGKAIFNRFAATPVLISTVNPDIRRKVAANILHDYGYFNGTVDYEVLPDKKDSLKAKLRYTVDMRNPYVVDTLDYYGFSGTTKYLIGLSAGASLIKPGKQFSVIDLDGERTRVSTYLRNMGYYYFRPDYLTYQADTTLVRGGHVSLRLMPVPGMPGDAERPFFEGDTHFTLYGPQSQQPTDSLLYKDLWIHYYEKLKVRPNMLYRWLNYRGYSRKRRELATMASRRRPEKLYSQYRQNRIQERLGNVGIFRYLEMKYVPRDEELVSDTLDIHINAMLDKPYDAELDFDVVMKSNNQAGPGASFTLTKNNVFGGGETWNVKLNGSYEWQVGKNSTSLMDSYEMGLSSSLSFPRVLFPRMGKREYDFPATTTFRLNVSQLNRAKYYRLLAFGGNVTYDFQPVPTRKHSFTPFRLTFNVLQNPTAAFEQVRQENPALYVSLSNLFIPAMEYTYTYDNSSLRRVNNPLWWQTTLASAGNVTSCVYKAFGRPFGESGKSLLGVPFAQYVKINSELRYRYKIDKNQSLAARVAAGVIRSYGNASVAPYTEQFYVGGANSIRAFAVRNIGPGAYSPQENKKYGFINHVGDVRMEANLEYRFRLLGDLGGALFLDAGNVWLLRKDEARPGGELNWKNFPKQIALGTGLGLRYDMDFLVFRVDCGVVLHNPYDTGKKGYYNVPSFKDGLVLHFAIGYPF